MQASAVGGFLDWVRDDDGSRVDSKFDAFRTIIAMAVFVESWHVLRYTPYQPQFGLHLVMPLAYGIALACCWKKRFARIATGSMFAGLVLQVALVFPENANHQYLLLCCLLFLTLPAQNSSHERAWAIAGVAWLVVIGLFWAGVQKLLYGYYFNGDFLAHRTATDANFQAIFRYLIPSTEFERLVALGSERGAGPFRVASLPFVLVSNVSWIGELLVPVLLVLRPTRRVGVACAIALLIAIQLAAREVYFAVIMFAMILLYWPGDLLRRLMPGFAVAYAGLLAMNFVALARGLSQ